MASADTWIAVGLWLTRDLEVGDGLRWRRVGLGVRSIAWFSVVSLEFICFCVENSRKFEKSRSVVYSVKISSKVRRDCEKVRNRVGSRQKLLF